MTTIDARESVGVPSITSLPVPIPKSLFDGVDLTDWQHHLLRYSGFVVVDPDPRAFIASMNCA